MKAKIGFIGVVQIEQQSMGTVGQMTRYFNERSIFLRKYYTVYFQLCTTDELKHVRRIKISRIMT